MIDLYENKETSSACGVEKSSIIRDFLVDEDDAPLGFDVFANKIIKNSPFALHKDKCGTNMYEVQTEVCS